MDSIERFSGTYHFLSNFYLINVEYNGTTYKSVEHGFQAAKTLNVEEREQIASAVSPGVAKRLGRHCKKRSDWETIRVSIMEDFLRNKFRNAIMKDLLLKTSGVTLIEGNTWHDQYWGSCTCPMHIKREGENMLGKLLMKIREELANEYRETFEGKTNRDGTVHS